MRSLHSPGGLTHPSDCARNQGRLGVATNSSRRGTSQSRHGDARRDMVANGVPNSPSDSRRGPTERSDCDLAVGGGASGRGASSKGSKSVFGFQLGYEVAEAVGVLGFVAQDEELAGRMVAHELLPLLQIAKQTTSAAPKILHPSRLMMTQIFALQQIAIAGGQWFRFPSILQTYQRGLRQTMVSLTASRKSRSLKISETLTMLGQTHPQGRFQQHPPGSPAAFIVYTTGLGIISPTSLKKSASPTESLAINVSIF